MRILARTGLAALMIVACGIAPRVATTFADEVLTNESVIEMVRAGLDEGVVVAKIGSTQGKYDLSAGALVGLKQAGVSTKIIEAMLKAGSPPAAATPASPFKTRNIIYYFTGGQYIEMLGMRGQVETNTVLFVKKAELVIEGHRASLRVSERQPVFFSPAPVANVPLVRLKQGDNHKDRNLHIGQATVFAGKSGLQKEDLVDVVVERDPRSDTRGDWFRIVPREPLPAGEYGFVAGRQVFDFGVDE